MIAFAHLHPVWAGVIWMSEVSIVAVSIGAMIGAVVNSKVGGDALANPAAQDRRFRRFAIKPASGLDQRLQSTFGRED